MSPSGYAAETIFSGPLSPERWMFGATKKTQESKATPTVRMSESIAPARSAPGLRRLTEDQQARHQRRIHRKVERVAERRELHLDPEELRIAVRIEVACEEQELADDEQEPGGACSRLVHPDAHGDRDRRREPKEVDKLSRFPAAAEEPGTPPSAPLRRRDIAPSPAYSSPVARGRSCGVFLGLRSQCEGACELRENVHELLDLGL